TTKLVGRENLHDVALPIENRDGGDDVVVRGQSNRVRRIVHGCCPPPLRRRGRCVGRQTLLFEGTIPYRGQGEVERGAVARVRGGPEPPAVRFDDRAADREAHAHAARLGGEEGVEELIRFARVDADAGVPYAHHDLVCVG